MKNASDSVLKRGYLLKQSEVFKQWHLRYFVLNKECLCYYRNEQESLEDGAPKEFIFFNDMSLYIDELPDKHTKYCLKIVKKSLSPKMSSRTLFLCCFAEHERNDWLSQILHAKAIALVVDPTAWIGNQETSAEGLDSSELPNTPRAARPASAKQALQRYRRKFSLGGNTRSVPPSCLILDDFSVHRRRKSTAMLEEWRKTLMVI